MLLMYAFCLSFAVPACLHWCICQTQAYQYRTIVGVACLQREGHDGEGHPAAGAEQFCYDLKPIDAASVCVSRTGLHICISSCRDCIPLCQLCLWLSSL
jgi:hypothetical protein